jgi:hypothetical protein
MTREVPTPTLDRRSEVIDESTTHDTPEARCGQSVNATHGGECCDEPVGHKGYHHERVGVGSHSWPPTHDTPEAERAAALRPWLRHKTWCNVKTDDPPDTERCKCGLAALLALVEAAPKP